MNMRMDKSFDAFDALIAEAVSAYIEQEAKSFDAIDTSSVTFDEDYYRKRARVIAKYRRGRRRTIKNGLLRVAVAVLVLLTLCAATVMAIKPLREAVFEAIIQFYEDYLTITYDPIAPIEPNEVDEDREQDVVLPPTEQEEDEPPTRIEEIRKPTNLPEGVVEDVVLQNDIMVYIDYYVDNELACTFRQTILSFRSEYLDADTVIMEELDIHGNIGYVMKYQQKEELLIIWSDDQYRYFVHTENSNLDFLVMMARSTNFH